MTIRASSHERLFLFILACIAYRPRPKKCIMIEHRRIQEDHAEFDRASIHVVDSAEVNMVMRLLLAMLMQPHQSPKGSPLRWSRTNGVSREASERIPGPGIDVRASLTQSSACRASLPMKPETGRPPAWPNLPRWLATSWADLNLVVDPKVTHSLYREVS